MSMVTLRRIAMWSGPRNLSTALMRSFSSRADCVVSDEPFYAAYLATNELPHPGREDVLASQPHDWQVVAAGLAEGPPPDDRPVWYQKLMAHHMREEMLTDWLNPLEHAFLIRHPGWVIQSYEKITTQMGLAETGLPWQWRLFESVSTSRGVPPAVIDATQLRRSPEATLRALCRRLELTWDPAMLSWNPGPHPSDGVWGEHWYANTWNSSGFVPHQEQEAEPPRLSVSYFDQAVELYEQLRRHCLDVDG